jgi:phosphoglycerate kinase
MQKELTFLGDTLNNPTRPLAAVIGGAKISSKIKVIQSLLGKVEKLLIGGAMVYTFFRALGYGIGDSLVEEDCLETAKEIMLSAKEKHIALILGQDSMIVPSEKGSGDTQISSNESIPAGWKGVDIGPSTIRSFENELRSCHTILWNGK